jgi:hypothetical protein
VDVFFENLILIQIPINSSSGQSQIDFSVGTGSLVGAGVFLGILFGFAAGGCILLD